MSSFKRKGAATASSSSPSTTTKTAASGGATWAGTRLSPGSPLSVITSTGIASLDDILGGGLPLSCALVVAAPDTHSSYGELVQRYFCAQGLASGHRVCVVRADGRAWTDEVMWLPQGVAVPGRASDGEGEEEKGGRVKIAWRYEKMQQFKTTVADADGADFVAPLDLGCRVPAGVLDAAEAGGRLTYVDVGGDVLGAVGRALGAGGAGPLRICVPGLGSPAWGDMTGQGVLRVLHGLRALLRAHTHGCASVSLDARVSAAEWGGPGWLDKVAWAADGALVVAAFTGNPALGSVFPGHHGLLQTVRLPAPHTEVAASDRLSELRGLGSSVENNLAFRCTRKRLVFETLHLDVEGGTGERRVPAGEPGKKIREKKRVGFESDRPELYDF